MATFISNLMNYCFSTWLLRFFPPPLRNGGLNAVSDADLVKEYNDRFFHPSNSLIMGLNANERRFRNKLLPPPPNRNLGPAAPLIPNEDYSDGVSSSEPNPLDTPFHTFVSILETESSDLLRF